MFNRLSSPHFIYFLKDVCHLSILTSGGYEDDEDVLLAQKDVIQKKYKECTINFQILEYFLITVHIFYFKLGQSLPEIITKEGAEVVGLEVREEVVRRGKEGKMTNMTEVIMNNFTLISISTSYYLYAIHLARNSV